MKLIVYNNKMGDIVRIGLYDENNKWVKWISKKLLDKYKIGRVCWNLSNKNETCALIKPSCKKLYGWKKNDLTKQGQWLLY